LEATSFGVAFTFVPRMEEHLGRRKDGSVWMSARGELCIKTKGGKRAYHRWVVEQYIGYRLSKEMTIHHIDGNHQNNNLSNLMIISEELHSLLHQYGFTDKLASNLYLYKKKDNKKEVAL
jgi:hypothetical protein